LQIISFLTLPVSDMNISEQDSLRANHINADIDTNSVSERSLISDITFYDSANVITRINKDQINGFPYKFIEKNRLRESEIKTGIIKHLKDGDGVAIKPFHDDWIVFIILVAAFIYASIRTFSRKLFPGVMRFLLFKGVGESESRDTGELFHWQSTIINLISFSNIALFVFCIAFYYGVLSVSLPGIISWLIFLGIVILVISFRHIFCLITGRISGQKEAFDEYIITLYQSYRYLALILFILVIFLAYSDIFAPKTLILAGYLSFAVLYVMCIIRLFLIFIKRNVSILYLILYLCALEILPVAVIVKSVTGLF
jgi:hypothetical protein